MMKTSVAGRLRAAVTLLFATATLVAVTSCATTAQRRELTPPSPAAAAAEKWSAAIPDALKVFYERVGYTCAVGWSDRDIVPACAIGWWAIPGGANEFASLQTQPISVPKSVAARYRRSDSTCTATWSPSRDPIPVCVLGWIAREDGKFDSPPPPIGYR